MVQVKITKTRPNNTIPFNTGFDYSWKQEQPGYINRTLEYSDDGLSVTITEFWESREALGNMHTALITNSDYISAKAESENLGIESTVEITDI